MPSSVRMPQSVLGFLAWWRGELAALWPRRGGDDADTIVWGLEPHGTQLSLQAGRDGAHYLIDPDDVEAGPPAGLKIPAAPVILRLDPGFAMSQPVELPLAAEEDLARVLAYQMDRETPFTAERVFFDFRITGRDRGAQQLDVELAIIPRRLLEPALECLRRWGVPMAAAQLSIEGGDHRFDVLPDAWRATASRWPRVINGILAVLLLALLGAGVALPLLDKQRTLDALEPRLAAARKEALVTNELRGQIQQLRDRLDFAVDEKRDRVKLLDVLMEITSLLPDDTWLLELEVRGNEVQMRGEAPNAAQLVGLLEASPQLHNARFRSPVVQVAAAGRERFHLSVELHREDEA